MEQNETWLAAHLYYEEPLDTFLKQAVFPYIQGMIKEGNSSQFFFIRYFEKINTHSFGIIPIELLPDTIERISWMDFHDAITYQVVCGNIFYGEILKDLQFYHQEQIDKTDAD